MRVLVTGANGQLGSDLMRCLNRRGETALATDLPDLDITDEALVRQTVAASNPEAVIHCAAYTAVNRAEEEPERCYAVNVKGTSHLAKACAVLGTKLIYISTDNVFWGNGSKLLETDDPKRARNVYGQTKLLGEEVALGYCPKSFVVRTSWLFGKNGENFVKTMLRCANQDGSEEEALRIVADQVGSPTYTRDLAALLCTMAAGEDYGVYHATNEGFCSWAEFAKTIFRMANLHKSVVGVASRMDPGPAKRPLNSRLSKASLDKSGFSRLPDWKDALGRFLEELKTENNYNAANTGVV